MVRFAGVGPVVQCSQRRGRLDDHHLRSAFVRQVGSKPFLRRDLRDLVRRGVTSLDRAFRRPDEAGSAVYPSVTTELV